MKKKKYHEALYDYIKTGGQGLVITVKGGYTLRFRLPLYEDVERSDDFSYYEIQKSSYLIGSTLQSIGGFDVSSSHCFDLVDQILNTPKLTNRLIKYYWTCVRESQSFASYFEAFCYTHKSRALWAEWKQCVKFGIKFSAQNFPLTELQKSWISYNETEDKKEKLEEEWSRAFFIGSSMNPKGVQKAQREWESRKKKDQEYRDKLVEEANKGELTEQSSDDLKAEKTVEELQGEYWDWVEGREDDHDIAVREYKEKVMEHIENRKNLLHRQTQEAIEMAEQVQALNSLSMSSPIRAYSDDEVLKMTQGRNKNTINFDEGLEYSEHLSKRYFKAQHLPGTELPSLQDQVKNRPLPKIER
jgi:hypothetical protein